MPSVRIPKWVGWPLLVLWTYFVLSLLVQWSMFHPEPYPGGLWHLQEHFRAEDVWLTASDGVRIHGWKLRARPHTEQSNTEQSNTEPPHTRQSNAEQPHADWVTLYLHGNAGNLTHRVDHMEAIPRVGSDLLIIDYRGYGKSEGKPTEEGIYRDADAAYEYLVEAGYRPENLVVYGESLGTAVAVDLASRRECAGVVLEAPFPSASAVASSVLPLLGPLAARGYLETAKKLPRVKAPVLVIHGTKDQVIGHELGRAVFDAAPEPKQFWSVEGARHSDIVEVAREQYPARLSEFLDQLRVR